MCDKHDVTVFHKYKYDKDKVYYINMRITNNELAYFNHAGSVYLGFPKPSPSNLCELRMYMAWKHFNAVILGRLIIGIQMVESFLINSGPNLNY